MDEYAVMIRWRIWINRRIKTRINKRSINMFWIKQIVIGDGERGLLYRNRRFQRVLPPGVYHFVDPRKRIAASVHNLAKPEYTGADTDVLMALMDGALAECFDVADIGTQQVGLVLKNGKLQDVLA